MAPDDESVMSHSVEQQALRSDLYRLLARLVRAAPDEELIAFLATLEHDAMTLPGADQQQLPRALASLSLAARVSEPRRLEDEYFQALVGVVQGEVVPYASWYLTGSLMEMPLVALRQDLKLLGFERQSDVHEPEDHLGALCEVMAMLIDELPCEQSGFFRRHLASWGERCCADLARRESPFYAAVGYLGQAFLNAERLNLGESIAVNAQPAGVETNNAGEWQGIRLPS
ncbi:MULTISPECIES: TorD/DmsD family molecular chaperone [Cobetia]|nr:MULTISPECIES: molecular chaperone TorD family protein [Cobetia]